MTQKSDVSERDFYWFDNWVSSDWEWRLLGWRTFAIDVNTVIKTPIFCWVVQIASTISVSLLSVFFLILFIQYIREKKEKDRRLCTHNKIGTIQRKLAWPLCKDDTPSREAFHNFFRVPHEVCEGEGVQWTQWAPFTRSRTRILVPKRSLPQLHRKTFKTYAIREFIGVNALFDLLFPLIFTLVLERFYSSTFDYDLEAKASSCIRIAFGLFLVNAHW